MANIKPFISSVVSKQLPEFVRDDYSTFVAFLEAYYEYLDNNYTKRNLKELRDIDETLEDFVTYFKNEVNYGISKIFENYDNVNQRLFVSKIKEYYNAKGSEAAYKFLFRLLYNKPIEVFYPKSQMLIASDGKWQQDRSFFVDVTTGDPTTLLGTEILITEPDGDTVTVFVERVVQIDGTIYEIFVQRYDGVIAVGDTVTYSTTFEATIVGTTVDYEIVDGGANFSAGDIFDIESATGSGTKIKVSEVDSNGAITKIQIVNFGTGYTTNFTSTVVNVEEFDDPSPIVIDLNSSEVINAPSNSFTNGFVELGYITVQNYFASDYVEDLTYVGTEVGNFAQTVEAGVDTADIATISFTVGAQANYPGYYSTNDGFISDSIFIQDSRYYQAFSYEIRIDEFLSEYKDTVKSFIHPSGLALFGDYQINNTFDIGGELTLSELQIRLYLSDSVTISESLVKTWSHPEFDSVTLGDTTILSTNKVLDDTQTITDSGVELNTTKALSDTQIITDNNISEITFGKTLSDTATMSETIGPIDFDDKVLSETANIAESLAYTLNKDTISESVSETDAGSILLNPYTEGSYWIDYALSDEPVSTF